MHTPLVRRARRKAERPSSLDERLGELLEALPLAVTVLDREANVCFWNGAAERLFGWRAGEVLGKPTTLVAPGEFEAFRRALQRDFSILERVEPQALRLHKNGTQLPVSIYVCPLRGADGAVAGVIRMFVDLSEQRRSEEALRRSIAQRDAAVERERTRIARELHDELGQALTALKMELALLAPRLAGDETAGKAAGSMTELVDQTMRTVRRLSTELRPALLDIADLFGAVQFQAQAFERHTGIPCRLDFPAQAFDPGRERTTAVFRVLQEILTNVARHAAATQVRIRLRRAAGRITLEVEDDGKGFDAKDVRADAYGLVGMRERAELLGGELHVLPRSTRGTRVRLVLPLA